MQDQTTTLFGDKKVTKDMLQALADLGYPKAARESMAYEQMSVVITEQKRYAPLPVIEAVEQVRVEYTGNAVCKAVYDMDIEALREAVQHSTGATAADKNGDTPLHVVTIMAFQDFEKAVEIIRFLKAQHAPVYVKNVDGLTPVDIARARSSTVAAYDKILTALLQ